MSGIILNCVEVLGLILSIMGVIAAFMFIFGIGKIKVGGKNKLQIKIAGIEIGIETGRVYFAIVLGIVLVITPFPISKHFGKVQEVYAEQRAIPTATPLEEGGYTISKEEVWINLQNRKEIGLRDYLDGDLSETERRIKIVIKDVGSGIEEVNFRHATSGPGIIPLEKPESTKWRRIEYESKEVVYNPFTSLLKGKEFFKKLLARGGRMTSYYITVPITARKGQEMDYKLKYRNSFQGRNFEWAGKVFSADTDILTMHITFPEDKPFKSFETYKRETEKAPKLPFNNPEIETAPDNHTLTWTIRDAKKGEQYYIKWLW
jgi:hypothetical protein